MPNQKFEWDPSWGTPEDNQITPGLEAFDGFHVGDRVVAISDGDESESEYFFEGDDGVVVGISKLEFANASWNRTELVVAFDGMDLCGVQIPSEKLDNLSR